MKTGSALVIGKFLPPHPGHSALIRRALAAAERVDVVVCDLAGQRPAAAVRAEWLRAMHPDANVSVVPDICTHGAEPCPPACSPAWAAHLRARGFGPWNAVVTSEPYGEPFAAALGARAIAFDPERRTVPLSGTAVRSDLRAHWLELDPRVRAGLVRRVVILGAESTGTTTLAKDLAARLGAPWVPEYGRAYTEERARAPGGVEAIAWAHADFVRIADEQIAMEERAIAGLADSPAEWSMREGPILVCDTDVLATAVWEERYLGASSAALLARAAGHVPDLYLLTSPDGVAFEQDGVRDGEHLREWMHGRFRERLAGEPAPWRELRGDRAARAEAAIEAIRSLPPLFSLGAV